MTTEKLKTALSEEQVLQSAYENISEYLKDDTLPSWIRESLNELIDQEEWEEINDRFHKPLSFGTGGMRGRTIGRFITPTEKGNSEDGTTPQYAAVGSNTLNELTVLRATLALYKYVESWNATKGILEQARIVIAHDVRHFSQKFAQLVAGAWEDLGGYAMLFDGPRSTPQLSFTVRNRYAHAGVVITASHNPSHDNGFKAYFADGGQLVPPHDKEIVKLYTGISLSEIIPWLTEDKLAKKNPTILPNLDDMAYLAALEDAVIDPDLIKDNPPKLVFTPIHGTGSIASVPALWDHGVEVALVDEQNSHDSNFTTVKSPNPENPEALEMGIRVAKKTKSDAVIGSDPDCDRIGVAVKAESGKFTCLTGNQIASLLAEYRILALKKRQIIRDENSGSFAFLKTFVTTPLISKIANANGIKCINTPTGFKWMAEKIGKYEDTAKLQMKEKEGLSIDFDDTELFSRMDILSRYSTCVILSAEESYGYLPFDLVRDKDGNASSLAVAEVFAYLKSIKKTPLEFLDSLYQKYGYHAEKTENIYFEGAQGSATIAKLTESYRKNALTEIAGIKVSSTKDFQEKGYLDEDEDPLVEQNFIFITLENDFNVAIRPSGTEPKIKYYLFGSGEASPTNLQDSKDSINNMLTTVGDWLVENAHERVK
jgi:phosphoglucomutase